MTKPSRPIRRVRARHVAVGATAGALALGLWTPAAHADTLFIAESGEHVALQAGECSPLKIMLTLTPTTAPESDEVGRRVVITPDSVSPYLGVQPFVGGLEWDGTVFTGIEYLRICVEPGATGVGVVSITVTSEDGSSASATLDFEIAPGEGEGEEVAGEVIEEGEIVGGTPIEPPAESGAVDPVAPPDEPLPPSGSVTLPPTGPSTVPPAETPSSDGESTPEDETPAPPPPPAGETTNPSVSLAPGVPVEGAPSGSISLVPPPAGAPTVSA